MTTGLKAMMALSLLGAALGSIPGRAAVLELYTSQGCSSCPPADALLGELAKRPDIVALAFHVGYWDSIGWRDRFAIPESVSRQEAYVTTLGLSSAFTPQLVIDGRTSVVGSDARRIEAALAQSVETIPVTAHATDGAFVVALPRRAVHEAYDVNLVAFLAQATTAIDRGENGGRTLAEFNIVRQFRRLAGWSGEETMLRVAVDTFPSDATRVAVLLQRTRQGPIAGSAVADLR